MNPLPRILSLSLFVVLAVLAALLAVPRLTQPLADPAATVHSGAPATQPERAARLVSLPARIAFPLALTGLGLAMALLVSLALRPAPVGTPRPPLATARAEIGALSSLAKTSVAQGQALTQERHHRQRAEEDAQLHQQLLSRSVEEKVRLGRDLHDGIIQSLYAAGLTIESARSLAAQDPAEADRRLAGCVQSLNVTIREVRNYISGLTPEHLRNTSYVQAVGTLAAELAAGRAVRFDYKIDEESAALLTPEQSIETLQVVREAVSNAIRHGCATAVTIALLREDGLVRLLVKDDGKGFDPAGRDAQGYGLGNMEARATHIGAQLRVDSTPGTGTSVLLTVPLSV